MQAFVSQAKSANAISKARKNKKQLRSYRLKLYCFINMNTRSI